MTQIAVGFSGSPEDGTILKTVNRRWMSEITVGVSESGHF